MVLHTTKRHSCLSVYLCISKIQTEMMMLMKKRMKNKEKIIQDTYSIWYFITQKSRRKINNENVWARDIFWWKMLCNFLYYFDVEQKVFIGIKTIFFSSSSSSSSLSSLWEVILAAAAVAHIHIQAQFWVQNWKKEKESE
jgi:hypothetical protein